MGLAGLAIPVVKGVKGDTQGANRKLQALASGEGLEGAMKAGEGNLEAHSLSLLPRRESAQGVFIVKHLPKDLSGGNEVYIGELTADKIQPGGKKGL